MLFTGKLDTENLARFHSIADLLAEKQCAQCGAMLQEGWSFCPNCGQSVDWSGKPVTASLVLTEKPVDVGVTRNNQKLTL